jgi:hypothetical protein
MPPLLHPRLHTDSDSDDDSVPERHPCPRQHLNYDSGDTESESGSKRSDNESYSKSESDSNNNDERANHNSSPLHPALARSPQSRNLINAYTHIPTTDDPDAPSGPTHGLRQHLTPPRHHKCQPRYTHFAIQALLTHTTYYTINHPVMLLTTPLLP